MRKCIRCGAEMSEALVIRTEGYSNGLQLSTDSKWLPRRVAGVRAAVCPECGEVSLFVDPENLKD